MNGIWDAFPDPKIWKFIGHIKTFIEPFKEHNLLEITSQSFKGASKIEPRRMPLSNTAICEMMATVPEILLHPAAAPPA